MRRDVQQPQGPRVLRAQWRPGRESGRSGARALGASGGRRARKGWWWQPKGSSRCGTGHHVGDTSTACRWRPDCFVPHAVLRGSRVHMRPTGPNVQARHSRSDTCTQSTTRPAAVTSTRLLTSPRSLAPSASCPAPLPSPEAVCRAGDPASAEEEVRCTCTQGTTQEA